MSKSLVDTVKKVMKAGLERHYCFSCAKPFDPYEAESCEKCGWLKCPHCGRCACDLSLEARIAIEQVFRTFCLACLPKAKCILNPRKKKKRGGKVIRGVSREDFLEFAHKYYPSLVADYEAGRISFEELKARVERDIGLAWIF